MDIDGSGAIDYTEFLAAGLGNRVNHEAFVEGVEFTGLLRSTPREV